ARQSSLGTSRRWWFVWQTGRLMVRIVFSVILVLFLIRSVRSLWGGIVEGLRQPARPRGGVPARGVQMVRAPVCGTCVVPDRAVALTVGRDTPVYFCSAACRDKYRHHPSAQPDRIHGRTA